MTSLPPRRNPTPTKTTKQHLTPLQTLLQMGFPKHRAEKALAATGNKGAQLATDWLLSHVNDPLLDDNSPREYILYACPTGEFLEQLQIFWEKSRQLCGWNGAHNFTPHITLVSFFKVPDEDAPHLAVSLKAVMEKQGAVLDEPLKLETYTSPNFMGFFVAEEHADYLKRIAMQYVKEVSNAIISDTYEHFDALTACFPWCTTTTARCIPRGSRSISLEPHVKSLHLTLAYQFPNTLYTNLKSLVDELNPSAPADWELRLYSRDSRVNGKQVHKVKYPYNAVENDELDLRLGDYLYISSEALSNSPDSWVEATSWLTGTSGEIYTERTAESDVWTLHQTVGLTRLLQQDRHSSNRSSVRSYHRMSSQDSQASSQKDEVNNNEKDKGRIVIDGEEIKMPDYVNIMQLNEPRSFKKVSDSDKSIRRVFLMRHAERMDFVFGEWWKHCFDESGNYCRKDLNMPAVLPARKGGPRAYVQDCPLTNCGLFQASMVGKAMKEVELPIEHVYCSPSYRCIQTCDSVLAGRGDRERLKIKIEPGLFEYLPWYPEIPSWLSIEELIAAGYNVDTEYKPIIEPEKILSCKETPEEFYCRSFSVTKKIIDSSASGNVLLVGHSSTLEVCSRQLKGDKPKSHNDMIKLIQKVPYCSLLQLSFLNDKWEITEPPFPCLTHGLNPVFDYKIFVQ